MMKNVSFFAALVTASGAAGTVSLFFSYAGGNTFLFAMAAFVLVLAGSFLLSALPEKKRFPLTALLFACLAAVLILFHSTLKDSFTAFSVPLFATLKEPYDVDLALPRLPEGASPLAAEVYMVLFLSWFSSAPSFPKPALSYLPFFPSPFCFWDSTSASIRRPLLWPSPGPS